MEDVRELFATAETVFIQETNLPNGEKSNIFILN